MQSAVQISKIFYDEQMPNSGQQSNILQKITNTQMNDLRSEIYNEENAQESLKRDTFKSITYDSHFSLYPDIFADNNLSPLNINDISENIEFDLNELPISFYQDKELIIDHSSSINEYVLHIPS